MLISVCIPAYKNVAFLTRLLDSLVIQTFRDYEVIVTDDSPDSSIRELISNYENRLPVRYFRNPTQLGMGGNWNEGISHAKGEWIKIMHDDDWFSSSTSLQTFADVAAKSSNSSFIFSAYSNHYSDGRNETVRISNFRWKQLLRNPATLFSKNIVGPPSVILHRNSGHLKYDKSIKWVIDIDFYIRYFKTTVPVYIDEPLINVGLGSHQVTMDCVNQRKVEIPENFYLLNKLGVTELKNIMIYDAFWRLMRNLEIEKLSDITDSGYIGDIPHAIRNIVKVQSRLPKWMYKKGLASKISMALSYIFNFNK